MCEPVSATLAVTAALMSAYSMQQQGQAEKKLGRYNQQMNEYAAQDAQRRGEEQAQQVYRQAALTKGAARNRMAARGLDLTEGTAADIQYANDFFAEQDASTARYNAARDAWSARQAGALARWQGDNAARQANISAGASLLSSASAVAGKWYTPSSAGAPAAASSSSSFSLSNSSFSSGNGFKLR